MLESHFSLNSENMLQVLNVIDPYIRVGGGGVLNSIHNPNHTLLKQGTNMCILRKEKFQNKQIYMNNDEEYFSLSLHYRNKSEVPKRHLKTNKKKYAV